MANRKWYKLDNAGKLYPSIATTRRSTIFRITARTDSMVDPERLQKALDMTVERYPYFKVELKRGLFWYYFEEAPGTPKVQPETFYPCMFLKFKKSRTFLFRVLYHRSSIHFEISHSLTDGYGAMTFLNTLLEAYFNPEDIETGGYVEGEWEDAFKEHYKKGVPEPERHRKAVHFPFTLSEKGTYHLLTGISPLAPLKAMAKNLGCTVTVLVAAMYFDAIQIYIRTLAPDEKKRLGKRIVMNIPVDLRQLYPSKTMKNFFISLSPEIDLRLGEYTLEEIIDTIKGYMAMNMNEKNISRFISRNVKNERLPYVKLLPLFLKNMVMPMLYAKYGESGYTSSVSNLGIIKLSESVEQHVEAIEFYPAPSEINKVKMCMNSYKDNIYISFGNTTDDTSIEKHFFRRLRKAGLPVKIETNRREEL